LIYKYKSSCCTSTKVQILTPEALCAGHFSEGSVCAFLATATATSPTTIASPGAAGINAHTHSHTCKHTNTHTHSMELLIMHAQYSIAAPCMRIAYTIY
jgi:hypothetical protein